MILILALAAMLASCGEAGLLDGVGDRTRAYVQGDATTTTAIVAVLAGRGDEGLVRAVEVQWFNDGIPGEVVGTSDEVTRGVWERQLSSRFVQASRAEIAQALPAIKFPDLVPETVEWVTSQLVFDLSTGTLDPDISAAFGFWTAEPYQSERARLAVLRVGRVATDLVQSRSQVVPIIVPDGISLGWTEAGHRYELFCRSDISEELCADVADSAITLAGLLP